MAEMGYGCVFGDCTVQPNHMVTTINPASTISTCDDHYAPSLIPILAAELGIDPGDFYTTVEKYLAKLAREAAKALADAQAAEAAKGSQGAAETSHDAGYDVRAARKAGVDSEGNELPDDPEAP